MSLNFKRNFQIHRGLAFSEDNVLIFNIVVYNVPRYLKHEDVANYFERFGEVLKVVIFSDRAPARRHKAPKMAFVNFANAMVAGIVLQKGRHIIGNKHVYVKACDSWRQPCGPLKDTMNKATNTNRDTKLSYISRAVQALPFTCVGIAYKIIHLPATTQTEPAETLPFGKHILMLNDDCLVLICRKLKLKDQIALALTSQRFRYVVETCFRIEYRVLMLDIFYDCSLKEIYVFLELAGSYINSIGGCMPLHNRCRIAEFVRKYCTNLKTVKLVESKMKATSFTQLLGSLAQVTELALIDCGLQDEAIRALSKLSKLTALKLDNNNHLTGKHVDLLTQLQQLSLAGCLSLKALNMITIFSELKNLKVLDLQRIVYFRSMPEFIIMYCDNLESLKVTIGDQYDWTNLASISDLKHVLLHFPNPDVNLNTECFRILAQKKHLESLNIISRRSITPATMALISQLDNLHTFICMRNLNVTDQCLIQLAELPNLEKINISGCLNFKKLGFLELFKNCKKLKLLNVQYCYQIVSFYIFEAIAILSKQRPRLVPIQLMIYRTSVTEEILADFNLKNADTQLKVSFETLYKMQLCNKVFSMFYYDNEEYEDWIDEEEDQIYRDAHNIPIALRFDTSSDNESYTNYSMENIHYNINDDEDEETDDDDDENDVEFDDDNDNDNANDNDNDYQDSNDNVEFFGFQNNADQHIDPDDYEDQATHGF